jgi:hypothetical protein
MPPLNIAVFLVDAKCSVKLSSAISVHIGVFHICNLNYVIHVLLRFQNVLLMCRNVLKVVLKVALK